MPRGVAVTTTGLGSVRRRLRKIDIGMSKALTAALREIGKESQARVRSSTRPPYRTGRTRRSVKVSVTNKGVTLYSNLPQAPVWNWGGTIEPRGATIRIPRTEFVSSEAESRADDAEDRLAVIFDALDHSVI